jgi:alpha-L-fucosidase
MLGRYRALFMASVTHVLLAGATNDAASLLARADMDADFVNNTATLNGGASSIGALISCSRNLAAYYTDAAGALTSVAVNTLRRGDRGALIENAATNVLLQSQTFDNASWSKSNVTVTANAIAAPDGTTTAERVVETTANGLHRVTQGAGTLGAGMFCVSVYAKADQRAHLDLALSAGSNYVGTIFHLSGAGAYTRTDDGGAQITHCRHGIQALANGWYRCWISGRTNASLSCTAVIGLSDGSTNSYTGNASNGLYLWGAQWETVTRLDNGPSSYIPTTTGSVARPADVVTFSDITWMGGTTDVLYAEYESRRGATTTILAVDATNDKLLQQDLVFRPSCGGAQTLNGGYGEGQRTKVAVKMAASDFRMCCNGGAIGTNASATAPGTVSAVRVGTDLSSTNGINGYVRRLAGWKGANTLTDGEMQTVAAQTGPVGVTDLASLQEQYFQYQTGMMYHWSMATFSPAGEGEQWAEGNESLADFAPTSNPTALDIANNWLDAAALIGAEYICPVSMHHDGFALWNSTAAPRSVGDTTWGGLSAANADFIKTLYDRATARGFAVSLYFSIWNRKFEIDNASDNGARRRAYTALVKNLLSELKVLCPDLKAIWTDGWGWQIGYYQVRWQDVYEHMKSLWPNCMLIENNHEGNYEQSDIITYEDGGGSALPGGNTAYAENNQTIYATPTSPARHWFYNINNTQVTGGTGESNGASGVDTAANLATARTHARNNHAHYQLNVGPRVTGFIGAAEVTELTALGTG